MNRERSVLVAMAAGLAGAKKFGQPLPESNPRVFVLFAGDASYHPAEVDGVRDLRHVDDGQWLLQLRISLAFSSATVRICFTAKDFPLAGGTKVARHRRPAGDRRAT